MRKQITPLSVMVIATGLYLACSFSANAQWATTGNTVTSAPILGINSGSYPLTIKTVPNQPINFLTNNTSRVTILGNGNVLIGKTTQSNATYKLDVAGSIRVNEVVVNTTGADFVFEKNYQLKKLEEVEAFIKENKHLPEIESAEDMSNNGLGVGKMNTQLLQKVEELTLYMIDMNKEIQNLKAENEKLKTGIKNK